MLSGLGYRNTKLNGSCCGAFLEICAPTSAGRSCSADHANSFHLIGRGCRLGLTFRASCFEAPRKSGLSDLLVFSPRLGQTRDGWSSQRGEGGASRLHEAHGGWRELYAHPCRRRSRLIPIQETERPGRARPCKFLACKDFGAVFLLEEPDSAGLTHCLFLPRMRRSVKRCAAGPGPFQAPNLEWIEL